MDAQAVYDQLQPLTLTVKDGISQEARRLLNELTVTRQQQRWDELDALATRVEGLKYRRPDYPISLLHLADTLMHAGRPAQAEDRVSEAQRVLQAEMGAAAQQNKAAASLYQGLVQHHMDRISEAVPAYYEACFQFGQAGREWELTAPGPNDARIDECKQAGAEVEELVKKVLLRPPVSTPPGPTAASGWKPVPQAALLSKRPAAQSTGTRYSDYVALGAAVVALLTVILGIASFSFGDRTGLLAFLITWCAMIAAALLIYRGLAGGQFRLRVPHAHAALVEERGQTYVLGPRDSWLLIPGIRTVRSVVPLMELSHTLRKHKVALGSTQGGDSAGHLSLTIKIGYQVADPELATQRLTKLPAGKGGPRVPVTPADLKEAWETKLADDLKSILADQLWGHAESECRAKRDLIQANLRNLLARKCRDWGANITELTILDMDPL